MSDFLKVMADGVRMGTLLRNGKYLAFTTNPRGSNLRAVFRSRFPCLWR